MRGQDIRKTRAEVSEGTEEEKMKVRDECSLNLFIFYNFIESNVVGFPAVWHHRANMKLCHILGHIMQDGKVNKIPVDYILQNKQHYSPKFLISPGDICPKAFCRLLIYHQIM